MTLGKQDSCHDIAHKKRGRPKLRDKASMMQSHFLANERKYEIMYDAIQTPAFSTTAHRANRPHPSPASQQQTGRIAFVHQTLEEFHEQQQQQQRDEEKIHERIIRRSFSKGPDPQTPLQDSFAKHTDHTHYLSSIDFSPSNLLADGPDDSYMRIASPPIQPVLSPTTPQPSNLSQPIPQVTIFMSMEVCCARASDEVTEAWGYYPQELAHRSFYDFVSPKDTDRLAQLHRLLLDNIQNTADRNTLGSNRQTRLPRTERTTSDLFHDTVPERLLTVANGSNTYSDTLHIKRRDGELELFNFKLYLGGGFGADLYNPDTFSKLYIVAIMSKHQYTFSTSNGAGASAATGTISTTSAIGPGSFEANSSTAAARSNFTETTVDSPMACDSPQATTPELKSKSSSISTSVSGDSDRFQMFRKTTSTAAPFSSVGISSNNNNNNMADTRSSPPRLSYLNAHSNQQAPPVSPKFNIAPTTSSGLLMNSNSSNNASSRFFPNTGNTSNASSSNSFRTMSLNPITGTLPSTSYYTRRFDPFVSPPNRFAPTPVARTAAYTHPTTQYFLQTSSSTLNAAASAAQTKTRGGPGYSLTPMSSTRGATDDLAPNDRATGKTESNPKMEMSITSLLC